MKSHDIKRPAVIFIDEIDRLFIELIPVMNSPLLISFNAEIDNLKRLLSLLKASSAHEESHRPPFKFDYRWYKEKTDLEKKMNSIDSSHHETLILLAEKKERQQKAIKQLDQQILLVDNEAIDYESLREVVDLDLLQQELKNEVVAIQKHPISYLTLFPNLPGESSQEHTNKLRQLDRDLTHLQARDTEAIKLVVIDRLIKKRDRLQIDMSAGHLLPPPLKTESYRRLLSTIDEKIKSSRANHFNKLNESTFKLATLCFEAISYIEQHIILPSSDDENSQEIIASVGLIKPLFQNRLQKMQDLYFDFECDILAEINGKTMHQWFETLDYSSKVLLLQGDDSNSIFNTLIEPRVSLARLN